MTDLPAVIDAVGKAIGYVLAPIATAVLAYFQSKCRRDLDVAHGRIRELMGQPGQYRNTNSIKRLLYKGKKDATASDKPTS